ncbi:MAG: alpha/beta hydrolase [Dehalococcoidia bacterium]
MPLDPQAQALLDQMAALNLAPMHTISPQEARTRMPAAASNEPIARVEDRVAHGPAGEIPVRIYTPKGTGPFPALVFFHGGGWVVGSVAGSDGTARLLANASGCVVVSVEYRLAPEHKYPAAADDAYAATKWVAEQSEQIGIDPRRIAVGGVSAGGNLAAVVALMARDRGGPNLGFQLLIVPVTDRNFATASYIENAEGYGLTRDSMVWFWGHYLPGEEEAAHPYASPMQAADLSGLPPAMVITAEFDPLRDEGEAYAARLRAAGVPVTVNRREGLTHGSFGAVGVDKGRQALQQAGEALRAALAAQPAPSE